MLLSIVSLKSNVEKLCSNLPCTWWFKRHAYFPEPTQIYRYLATRNMVSPVFLPRNLTFMKKRMSRNSSEKVRHSFKVDSLLKRKESETKCADTSNLERYLNLTLLGYCDKKRKTTHILVHLQNQIMFTMFFQFQLRNH